MVPATTCTTRTSLAISRVTIALGRKAWAEAAMYPIPKNNPQTKPQATPTIVAGAAPFRLRLTIQFNSLWGAQKPNPKTPPVS